MEQSEVRKTLINAIKNDSFLKTLSDFEFKEVRAKESIIIKALISLHNEAIFDLNEQFLRLDDQKNLYGLMCIYCAALPYLVCSVVDVIDVFLHVKEKEIPPADFYESYSQFCKKDIERPIEALSYLLDESEKRHELIQNTLMPALALAPTWVATQFSNLTQHPNPYVRWQIYLTIGRMPLEDECSPEKRFELINKASVSENNPMAKSGIVRAVVFLAKQIPTLWLNVNQILENCLALHEEETIHEAVQLIAYNNKGIPEDTIHLLISYSKNVSPQSKGTFSHLTIVISNAIKTEKYDIAENLLKSLLLKDESITIDSFSHLTYELMDKENSSFLNFILTKWLLSGDIKLCKTLHDIVLSTGLTGYELSIDESFLPLTDNKILFLAKKVVGWFYFQPISAISYLLSILPYASSDIKLQIEQLIYDPLLLSYMGKSKRYVQDKLNDIDDENIKLTIHRLLSELDKYCSDINKTDSVKELQSPQREVDLYWNDFNIKMNQEADSARKGSIMELFTTQTILYGHDVVSHRNIGSKVDRIINTMTTFSHSTEMPKIDVFDPEGLNIMLRVFRTERLKNEADS